MDSPLQRGVTQTRILLSGIAAGICSHQVRCYFKEWMETSVEESAQVPKSPESVSTLSLLQAWGALILRGLELSLSIAPALPVSQ